MMKAHVMEIKEQETGMLLGKLKFNRSQWDLIEQGAKQCQQLPDEFVRMVILDHTKKVVDKK